MLFDLTDYGLLTIQGNGAEKLLQGQFTCNVLHANAEQSLLGAHCNPKGRVISLFHLFRYLDHYYLFMHKSMLTLAQATLQKYAPFYKVTLTQEHAFYIYGSDTKISTEQVAACVKLQASQNRYLVVSNNAPDAMLKNNWQHYDLQAGIVTIYPETSAVFLPHELNLPSLGAIDFAKGCYTGQEIIARLEYLGKQKQILFLATCAANFKPGAELILSETTNCAAVTVVDCYQTTNAFSELLILANATTEIPATLNLASRQSMQLIKRMSTLP